MGQEFYPLARFTRTHVCAYSLIQFGQPPTLAYHVMVLFTTEMATISGVMRLIDDAIFEILIMRNYNARRINRICTVV